MCSVCILGEKSAANFNSCEITNSRATTVMAEISVIVFGGVAIYLT